jgi:acetolactate synthase-1/2/3 large subunit
MGLNREPDVGVIGDVKSVLAQLLERSDDAIQHEEWIDYLTGVNLPKLESQERSMSTDARPIHPLRLCKEIRDFLPRSNRVLCVDGHEILGFARQSIPFHEPRSLTPGPYGCMGVGLPFALGAKLALPDHLVLVLHGDGSFGWNAMEMDTALRHGIPIICVIGNNGGHTADSEGKIGRELGHTRYDAMFEAIGCHAELVEDPLEIRPALERAVASGKPAIVNVLTDPKARANDSIVYTPARMRIRGGATAMV